MIPQTQIARPIHDIEEDIRRFIRTYDPLKQARPYFEVLVAEDGFVTLRGHVRSVQARRVLVDNVPEILGVTGLDESQLYDDETLRLNLGRLLPRGIRARVNFGHVALHGALPGGVDAAEVIAQVSQEPGIHADTIEFTFY